MTSAWLIGAISTRSASIGSSPPRQNAAGLSVQAAGRSRMMGSYSGRILRGDRPGGAGNRSLARL